MAWIPASVRLVFHTATFGRGIRSQENGWALALNAGSAFRAILRPARHPLDYDGRRESFVLPQEATQKVHFLRALRGSFLFRQPAGLWPARFLDIGSTDR